MAGERIKVTVAQARERGEQALRQLGYDADGARIIADHVIDAALCGYEYSGLAKILNIPEHRRFHWPRKPLRIVHETAVSTLFDAGNENGMLAMYHATRHAIAMAQARGIALVGVTNSWMSGRSAYYMEMVANADLVGIHTASSFRYVAPPGAIAPALGTNPIAFGLPSDRGPVVLDMGTSAFMATELQLRKRLDHALPDGVAIDPAGQPTRDPGNVGALLTWGGYKGFGLALMVQALGVLGGSGLDQEGDDGYLFIVFKPDLLRPLADTKREIAALVARVKATPKAPGVDDIRIPSERAFQTRERLRRDGLELDRAVWDALATLRATCPS